MTEKSSTIDLEFEISRMLQQGAFRDYDRPLGETDARTINSDFPNPAYPGHMSYYNGPRHIRYSKINLPADMIDAQYRSIADAINFFMPDKTLMLWMHEFFAGNFMESKAFKRLNKNLDKMNLVVKGHDYCLPDKLTLNLDSPERFRNDRQLFTSREYLLAHDICNLVPALRQTVIAYQAAYVEYLGALGEAIQSTQLLTDAQKRRGENVIFELKKHWETENFINTVMPAVAIHYYMNHDGKVGESLTQEDFTQGMMFAVKNGMFRNKVAAPDGVERRFLCPAKGSITRISSSGMSDRTDGNRETEGPEVGVALFHIYRLVEQHMKKDVPQKPNRLLALESFRSASPAIT